MASESNLNIQTASDFWFCGHSDNRYIHPVGLLPYIQIFYGDFKSRKTEILRLKAPTLMIGSNTILVAISARLQVAQV